MLSIKKEQVAVEATVYEFDEAGNHYRFEVFAPELEYGDEVAYSYRLIKTHGKDQPEISTGIVGHFGHKEKQNGHDIELFVEDTHEYFMGIAVDRAADEAFFISPDYIESLGTDIDLWPLTESDRKL